MVATSPDLIRRKDADDLVGKWISLLLWSRTQDCEGGLWSSSHSYPQPLQLGRLADLDPVDTFALMEDAAAAELCSLVDASLAAIRKV